jgi:hypothetical protein
VVVERGGRKVCYVGANCGAVQIPVPDTSKKASCSCYEEPPDSSTRRCMLVTENMWSFGQDGRQARRNFHRARAKLSLFEAGRCHLGATKLGGWQTPFLTHLLRDGRLP